MGIESTGISHPRQEGNAGSHRLVYSTTEQFYRRHLSSSIYHHLLQRIRKQHAKQCQRLSRTSASANRKQFQHKVWLNTNLNPLHLLVKQTVCTGPSCPTKRETGNEGYFADAFGLETLIYIANPVSLETNTINLIKHSFSLGPFWSICCSP